LGMHHPALFPDFARQAAPGLGMVFLEGLVKEMTKVVSQWIVGQKELFFRWHPLALVQAQSSARYQVMNMRMIKEGAAPSVQDAQHSQGTAEMFGIGRQILQGLRAGLEQEVIARPGMRANPLPERLRQGEGDQEIGRRKQQPRLLACPPLIGVGLTAERTMPVVARMIAKVVRTTVWTSEELAAQGRGAATQDAFEHLALPRRHGRAEALQILRPLADQPFVKTDRGRRRTSLPRGCLHRSDLGLEIAHEAFQPLLVLGLTEAGQVRIDDGGRRTFVSEVDLDLAQVLPLLQKMGGVGMAQRMHMGLLFDATLLQSQSKGPLQSGAAHWFVGRGGTLATMSFSRKEPDGVAMSFPERAQMFQGAFGQGHVAVAIAFAGPDVEEHPSAINVAHLQVQTFAQTQSAGVKSDQGNALVEGGSAGKDEANLLGGEDNGEFETGLSANQFQFRWPDSPEAFLPEELDGAKSLGGGLAGDFLDALEVDKILAQLFRTD